MQHISELRLVKGITQEVYDDISPYLTALPANTAVNVNTAKSRCNCGLNTRVSIANAENLIDERNEAAFESIQEFMTNPLLQGLTINLQSLSTESSYFSLNSEVKIGNSFIKNESILNRVNTSNVKVVSRVPAI